MTGATLKAVRELRRAAKDALKVSGCGYIPWGGGRNIYNEYPEKYDTLHTRPITPKGQPLEELFGMHNGKNESTLRYLKREEHRLYYLDADTLTKFRLTPEFVQEYIQHKRERRRYWQERGVSLSRSKSTCTYTDGEGKTRKT